MNTIIKNKFDTYPEHVKVRLLEVRALIFEVREKESIDKITETLKWGEPSYLTKKGSTIRMGWKSKTPECVSMFFHCQTTLIETFKEVYGDTFQYIGNREIILPISGDLPLAELKACISMSLRYHSIKHLPLLGA